MATIVSTYTREDGHTIDVYESGAERDRDTGRLTSPARHTLITADNATEYHRRRREKTSEALRAMIVQSMNSGLLPAGIPRLAESSEAIAAALTMLYEQVTMNSEAYPRDRLAVLELVGKTTGDLADRNQPDPDGGDQSSRALALALAANADTARTLAKVLQDVQAQQARQPRVDVIDGESTG